MQDGIDFLKAQKKAESQKTKPLLFLKIGSIVVLIAYCVLATAIFSYSVYLVADGKNITKQVEAKKKRIEELRRVELLQVMLKGRLSLLHELVSKKRTNYPQLIAYLKSSAPEGFSIRTLKISEEGEVAISGMAPNAQIASQFLDNLTAPSSEVSFEKAILSSAARSTDGVYNLNLVLKK